MIKKKRSGTPFDPEALEKHLGDIASQQVVNEYQLGELWNEAVKNQIWKTRNFANAQEYLDSKFPNLDLKAPTLSNYSAVTRMFSAADEAEAGMGRLRDLISYGIAAAITSLNPPCDVPVKVPAGGQVTTKPFSKCTDKEVRSATIHALGRDVVAPIPPAGKKLFAAIQQELLGLTHDPIKVRPKMVDGKLFFDFGAVSAEEIGVFANGLATVPLSGTRPTKRPRKK